MKDTLNRSRAMVFVLSLALFLASACSGGNASADEQTEKDSSDESFFSRAVSNLLEKEYQVPEGTQIQVRLSQPLGTAYSRTGTSFEAVLDRDLAVQDVLLAPASSRVEGQVIHADDSNRVKGRAEMTLTLNTIWLDGVAHSLETQPMTFRAQSTAKKDAAVIGGSSAVGAVIGALTDGKKGAAIGAGVGAGAGTGFVLATKGKEIELARETALVFVLSEPLELPAYERE